MYIDYSPRILCLGKLSEDAEIQGQSVKKKKKEEQTERKKWRN